MALDDTPDDGESDAASFKVFILMRPLKHPEQLLGELHIKADSIVLDIIDRSHGIASVADLDAGPLAPSRKFERILEQVHINDAQEGRVRLTQRQLAEDDLDRSSLLLLMQVFQGSLDQFRRIRRPFVQRLPAQTREGQQIIANCPICCAVPRIAYRDRSRMDEEASASSATRA